MVIWGVASRCHCDPVAFEVPQPLSLALGCTSALLGLATTLAVVQRLHTSGAWSAAKQWLREMFASDPSMDMKTLDRIVQEKRLEIYNMSIELFVPTGIPMTLAGISILCFLRIFPDPVLYIALYIGFMCVCCGAAFLYHFRRYFTLKSADLLVITTFAIFGVLPCFATTPEGYHFMIGWTRAVHFTIAITSLSFWSFLPINIIHLAIQIWTVTSLSLSTASTIQSIFLSALTMNFNLIVCFSIKMLLLLNARFRAKAEKATKTEAAVSNLLTDVCDALVSLDEDWTLRDDAEQLGGLLLAPPPSQMVRAGKSFRSLVASTDLERFDEMVNRAGSPSRHKKAISTQVRLGLRDADGSAVHVRLYHMCLEDPFTSIVTRYLGVVEENEHTAVLCQAPVNMPPPAAAHVDGRTVMPDDGASSKASYKATPVKAWSRPGEPALLTLRTWLHWDVVDVSPSCQSIFGFSQDSTKPEDFLACMGKPHLCLRWLEYLHLVGVSGTEVANNKFEKVLVSDALHTIQYSTDITATVVSTAVGAPDVDAEAETEQTPFNPLARFVEVKLKMAPAKQEKREQPRGRADGPLASMMGEPAQDASRLLSL